jgi:hypothetical protein
VTLQRLGRHLSDVSRLFAESDPARPPPISVPIDEAIKEIVMREAGLAGAPAEAATVARRALLSGYRYARMLLGTTTAESGSSQPLNAVDQMYVYGLVDYLCPSDPEGFGDLVGGYVRHRLVPRSASERYALEESAYLHWFFGVGLAAAAACE